MDFRLIDLTQKKYFVQQPQRNDTIENTVSLNFALN